MADESMDRPKIPAKQNPVRLIVLSIVMVVLLLSLLIFIYAKKGSDEPALMDNEPDIASTVVSTNPAIERVVDEGVTWMDAVKLADLRLIEKVTGDEVSSDYVSTDYYKVGTLSDGGEIIMAKVYFEFRGPSSQNFEIMRFIKRGDDYKLLGKNQVGYYENPGYKTKDLHYDDSYILSSLLPDQKITIGSTQLIQKDYAALTKKFDSSPLGKKVGDTRWGNLYQSSGVELTGSEGTVSYAYYYVVLNDSTRVVYEPLPSFMRDDGTLHINTNIEKIKGAKFARMVTGGCGGSDGSFPLISSQSAVSGKKEAGKSTKGSQLYYVDDKENPVIKFSYNAYSVNGAIDGAKPIDEYVSNYGIIFWIDDLGSTQIYMNQDYLPMAECGKPVIYLYPRKETPVEVKVGANVTVSEPAYGRGWKGVAKPSGQIVVDGKVYPNLFWEGIGWGVYPQINSGTVVKTAEARATIVSQLEQMNLNSQEINDFLEFWMPKIPNTEYLRISWIYGEEMDELAPLYISPKPDSLIRVFMDFAGLETPIDIEKQVLPKFERRGFTAVEWGGLLAK